MTGPSGLLLIGLLAASMKLKAPSALYDTLYWPNTPSGLLIETVSDTGVVSVEIIRTLAGGLGTVDK